MQTFLVWFVCGSTSCWCRKVRHGVQGVSCGDGGGGAKLSDSLRCGCPRHRQLQMQLSQFQQIAGGYINKAQSLMKTWPSKLMAAGWMDGDWWRQRRAATVSGGSWRARMCKKKKKKASGRTGRAAKLDGPAGLLGRKSKRGWIVRRVRGRG